MVPKSPKKIGKKVKISLGPKDIKKAAGNKAPERSTRKNVRALFCIKTKYIKNKNLLVFSDNISMGGVFLETFDPLPEGTKVTVRFPLKSILRPIEIEGKVVWQRQDPTGEKQVRRPSGMAIVFEKVKNKDLQFMREFLDHTMSYGWFLE